MTSFPRLTVLMPVYNGAPFLRESIESILAQSYTDFEFLIINDASTDRSADIIKSYRDQKIRLVENEHNCGLIAALNLGLALAKGEYIARMDCDDISLPKRLEKQVAFMDSHQEIGISGTWIKTFGDSGSSVIRFPINSGHIRCSTLFHCCLGHPSIIMRTSSLVAKGLCYNPAYRHAEDYALWAESLNHFELANLPEVLLLYRQHPLQVTACHDSEQAETVDRIRKKLLEELGLCPTSRQLILHDLLSAPTLKKVSSLSDESCKNLIETSIEWLGHIHGANKSKKIYPEPELSKILFTQWFILFLQVLILKRSFYWKGLFTVLQILKLKKTYILNRLVYSSFFKLFGRKYLFY